MAHMSLIIAMQPRLCGMIRLRKFGQKQYVQRQTRVWINCPTFGLAIRLPATSLHRRQSHLVCLRVFLCLQGRAIALVVLLRWAL